MGKEQVLFSLADDPESDIIFDAPKIKARTNIGDSQFELSRNLLNKDTSAKLKRDFDLFKLTGEVGKINKGNTASLRTDLDRAFIEASKNPYNRALSAGYSDGNFNANFQRNFPNDGRRPSNSLNLGYKTTFADGGPAQQVTQFQPTFSQQGLGSIQQAPDTPAMEMSPQDYYSAPTQQYFAPAANPMTAGLGSYMEGLKYQAPAPVALVPAAPAALSIATTYNPQTQQYILDVERYGPEFAAQLFEQRKYNQMMADAPQGSPGAAGGSVHGATIGYAQGGSIPQGIASLGRGQDSMLVHMTPGEVHGLQQLATAYGGSLTINPQTGLPEAGILSALLPLALGFALGPVGLGMNPLAAAATVGGVGALSTGSLSKGLTYGLGAYGGAGLGGSLAEMGVEQANALVGTETNAAAKLAGDLAYDNALARNKAYRDLLGSEAGIFHSPYDPRLADAAVVKSQAIDTAGATFNPPATSPAGQALARGPAQNMYEGVTQLGTKEGLKTLGGKLGYAGMAGLAAPLVSSALTPNKFVPQPVKPSTYYNTSYNPPRYNPTTGMYDPASYGPGSSSTVYAAQGGAIEYARGGLADFYPLTGDRPNTGGLGGVAEKPKNSREINDSNSGAGIYDNKAGNGPYSDSGGIYENTPSDVASLLAKTSATTLARYKTAKNAAMQAAAIAELRKRANAVNDYGADTTSAAQGGLMGLNTYAAGGKLLRGPGDGMSDSIPAVIQGAKPQRAALADGEFVIPADVVSHLGNGSTEAGSKRLYSMMDKVRRARTGNPKQGKQINPERFIPA